MKTAGMLLLLAASTVFLCGCSPVDVSGQIRHRKVIGDDPAAGPGGSKVYGIGYDSREWDGKEPIPAGKGRVVLLRPRSPEDQGAGLVFKINDSGDYLLGTGCALAWNHPAGTLKIRFVSRFAVGSGENRLPGNAAPAFFRIPEGKTHWVLVTPGRTVSPVLTAVEEPEAQKIMAARPLKRSALPKSVEEGIPWLP